MQKIWKMPCFGILRYLMLRGAMKGSRRAVEVTSFRKKGVMRSFLKRKAVRSCLKKPLQVNL